MSRAYSSAILAGTLLLAACAGGGPSAAEQDAVVDLLVGGPTAARYRAAVERRAHELTWECMKERGFDYEIPVGGTIETTSTGEEGAGYGIVAGLLGVAPEAPQAGASAAVVPTATAAYEAALNGDGGLPGCLAQSKRSAEQELGGESVAELARHAARLSEEMVSSEAVARRHDEWRGCMADAGFHFRDEGELVDHIYAEWERASTRARQERLLAFEVEAHDAARACRPEGDDLMAEAARAATEARPGSVASFIAANPSLAAAGGG